MTIKLAPHVTMYHITRWLKKGATFEICGDFNAYITTNDDLLFITINQENNNG